MNCPKCGCKMKKQIICPYCKITGDEVKFASNYEAKKRIRNKETEEVYMSSYIPYDVDKKKLAIIMAIGGFFGFDAYYLGRHKFAIIKMATIALGFLTFVLSFYFGFQFLTTPSDILAFACTIFLIGWFSNMIGLIFNKAKVPVVLPTKEELRSRLADYKQMQDEKERNKEEKVKEYYDKKVKKEQEKIRKEEKKKKKDEEK